MRVALDTYRRLTLAASLLGAGLFGAGLVGLVQGVEPGLALALLVAGVASALATAFVQIEGAPPTVPPSLLLYTRKECLLCDEARALLEGLRGEVPFDLWEVDVDASPEDQARFGERVPVGLVQGRELFAGHLDEAAVRAALTR